MNQIIERHIDQALTALYPHGEGRASRARVAHHLNQIASYAFREGRNAALMGLMTAQDVADHFRISRRRANEIIRNRHKRWGTGMKVGNQWLVRRDELDTLEPDARYRRIAAQLAAEEE